MVMDEEPANWQQFRGTELGTLLTSLYGNPRPAISYPKPKTKSFAPTGRFSSSGTLPVPATKKNVTVAVPKPTGGSAPSERARPAPVDLIARRKGAGAIKAEMDEIQMRQAHYRGPLMREIGDREKDRFAQICAFKGGKALPEELTCPAGEAPFELADRRRERDRVQQVMMRRNPAKYAPAPAAPVLSDAEQLKEQIASEINERRQYLEEMRSLKLKVADEATLRGEIAQRVAELQKLER